MRKFIWLLLLIGWLLAACSSDGSGEDPPGYTRVTAAELSEMMENKDFTLVNVHIPYEGDLPETDLSIPFQQINSWQDELPGKNEKIVLYCRTGHMSTIAANALVDEGYTQIYELDGGFNLWKEAGLPFNEP